MSADLFAEFEPFKKPKQQSQQPPQPKSGASRSSQPTAPAASLPSFNSGGFGATSALGSLATPASPAQHPINQWFNYQQPSAVAGWAPSPGPNAAQSPFPDFNDGDDDEAWGDFEVAQPVTQRPAPIVPPSNAAVETRPKVTPPLNPTLMRTRIVRANTMDLLSNNLLDLPEPMQPLEESKKTSWTGNSFGSNRVLNRASAPLPPKPKAPSTHNSAELLFDADDFDGEQQEDDDDFGEFETVQPVQSPDLLSPIHSSGSQTNMVGGASQFLSGLNLGGPPSPYPQAPRSPSFHERNPFPGLALNTPTPPPQKVEKEPEGKAKTSPITAWPSIHDNSAGSNAPGDDWGSFEDFPAEKEQPVAKPVSKKPPPAQKPVVPSDIDSSWDWDPVDTDAKADEEPAPPKDGLPPTNIPPPSILLSIFPELFKEANEKLYQPVSGQSFSIKKRILSDPKTIEFLQGYLALTVVGSRIIAGRRLRWHRDKFLSQRMSISAAGSKGMKLASVDKAETAREDREAADVIAAWNEHVGRLRSAVAAANSSLPKTPAAAEHLKPPEIRETMQVQTAKGVPTAPKACLICGLKRDERVVKVDQEVEDSFGEWWADHWGHTTCKRFWLQHEAVLRQR